MKRPAILDRPAPLPANVRPARPRWWQWPTILSLDAPAITLAWQALAADAAGVTLGWPARVVLATSIWLAYVADRWLEGWRLDRAVIATPRHYFHRQWRWPLAATAGLVFGADVWLAVRSLPAADLTTGVWLALAAAAYVVSHQWLHRGAPWRVPKEVCIALLLAAGVWLFVRGGDSATVWSITALFALLCLSNTALISRWEAEIDRGHGQSSLALDSPRTARLISVLPWTTLLAALMVAATGPAGVVPAAWCASASALLLLGIDRIEPLTGWPLARVLADLSLLTPAIALTLR